MKIRNILLNLVASSPFGFLYILSDFQPMKRGFYPVDIKVITNDAEQTKPEEITKEYVRLPEQTIIRNPDNWLWSHRRWKER